MYLSTIWGRHPRKHDTAKTFQKARLWGQRILVFNRFIFPLDKWIHCPVICLEVLSANKKILKEQRNCIATIPSFGKWSILEMKNLNDSWFSLPKCNWPRLSCLPRKLTLEGEEGLQDRERRRHEGRGKRTQTLVRTGSGWHFLGVLSPLPRHPLLTNPVNLCMTQNHL